MKLNPAWRKAMDKRADHLALLATSGRFHLDPDDELIVDNFAGGGGASTGIELALGRHVDIAVNHDAVATALHAANHPHTRHLCEDVFKVSPEQVTGGRRVGLAWFSPDCKHFSKAKGGKPRSKKIRGLAWVVLKWAGKPMPLKPRVIFLENVEEFQDWGPLLTNGQPCPVRKGRTFKSFIKRLKNLGYAVEWRELRACDYGAPTIRNRLYLIARCDGQPIVWPEPTHGDPAAKDFDPLKLQPWRTAAECIDWSLPCYSIFLNKRVGRKVNVKRPLVKATMRRLARGVFKFVIHNPKPFIVEYHSAKRPGDDRISDIEKPLPTQTTNPRFAVTAVDHHSLVTANMMVNTTGHSGGPANAPLRTVATGGHHNLVASHLTKFYGTNIGQPTNSPLHAITALGNHVGEVRAFLIKYYSCGGQDQNLRDPLHTVPTKDRFGLVTVEGEDYAITDIGMRMLAARELYNGQGFPAHYRINLEIEVLRHGKVKRVPLSNEAQVRMCGNSVSPPVARALVAANCPELKRKPV